MFSFMQIAAIAQRPNFWQRHRRVHSFIVLCENHASPAAPRRFRSPRLAKTRKLLAEGRNFELSEFPHGIAGPAIAAYKRLEMARS